MILKRITDRADFCKWLMANSDVEKEYWVVVKRGKTPPADVRWYIQRETSAGVARLNLAR